MDRHINRAVLESPLDLLNEDTAPQAGQGCLCRRIAAGPDGVNLKIYVGSSSPELFKHLFSLAHGQGAAATAHDDTFFQIF